MLFLENKLAMRQVIAHVLQLPPANYQSDASKIIFHYKFQNKKINSQLLITFVPILLVLDFSVLYETTFL